MRHPEKCTLQKACGDPRAAASPEAHGHALHEKSAKHEFLVKARSDKCIENAEKREFQISLHILELAEVATKSRLFRKVHGDENNRGEPDTDHERAHPTRRPLKPDVGQPLAAQPNQSLSDRHCKNRFRLRLKNWLAFTASRYCSPSSARARRRFARSADRREADPNPGASAANHSLSYWAVVLPPPVALTQDPSHLSEHK